MLHQYGIYLILIFAAILNLFINLGWILNGGYNYNLIKYEVEVSLEYITQKNFVLFFFLVKKLQQLHDKHLTRPDFDENSSEEKEIESITKDITAVSIP